MDFSPFPNLSNVQETLRAHHRFAAPIVSKTASLFGERWCKEFDELLATLFPRGEEIAVASRGYARFALESLRLQALFEKERRYRSSSFAEAEANVYANSEYMLAEYLPGLLLSHYLWAHHYRQLRYFESTFIDVLRVRQATRFAEVGIGTGLYSRRLLQIMPEATGVGFDISPSSKAFAERQIAAFGLTDRYAVELRNVIETPTSESFDALLCIEVLEHLEQPETLLQALRGALRKGGTAFITAALNAAHTDHIYLYTSPDEVAAQLIDAGFSIDEYFVGPAYPPPSAGTPVPLAAAFIVS